MIIWKALCNEVHSQELNSISGGIQTLYLMFWSQEREPLQHTDTSYLEQMSHALEEGIIIADANSNTLDQASANSVRPFPQSDQTLSIQSDQALSAVWSGPLLSIYRTVYSKGTMVNFKHQMVRQNGICKQCRPRSDCSWRSNLIRVYSVCHSTEYFKKQLHKKQYLGKNKYGMKCSKF